MWEGNYPLMATFILSKSRDRNRTPKLRSNLFSNCYDYKPLDPHCGHRSFTSNPYHFPYIHTSAYDIFNFLDDIIFSVCFNSWFPLIHASLSLTNTKFILLFLFFCFCGGVGIREVPFIFKPVLRVFKYKSISFITKL